MWPVSLVLFALATGFLAGHGVALPFDLIPLIVAIVAGFLAIKATDLLYERK